MFIRSWGKEVCERGVVVCVYVNGCVTWGWMGEGVGFTTNAGRHSIYGTGGVCKFINGKGELCNIIVGKFTAMWDSFCVRVRMYCKKCVFEFFNGYYFSGNIIPLPFK